MDDGHQGQAFQEFTLAAAGGTEILYQVSCMANNAATNATSKITAVYACKPVSDGCLRKI